MHRPTDNTELAIDLVSEVMLLSRRQREGVIMMASGMTQTEIAIHLGISQPAVWEHINKGLERLRIHAVYLSGYGGL